VHVSVEGANAIEYCDRVSQLRHVSMAIVVFQAILVQLPNIDGLTDDGRQGNKTEVLWLATNGRYQWYHGTSTMVHMVHMGPW
jgi:hypothetical protein